MPRDGSVDERRERRSRGHDCLLDGPPQQGALGDRHLEAAGAPARASLGPAHDGKVRDHARGRVRTHVQAAVGREPGVDHVPHEQVDHARPGTCAVLPEELFGVHESARVPVDANPHTESLTERPADGHVLPPEQRVVDDRAGLRVDPPAGREPDAPDARPIRMLGEKLAEVVGEVPEDDVRIGGAVRVPPFGDDAAAQVDDRERGVRDGDVRPDDVRAVGPDLERHVGTTHTLGRRMLGRFAQQPPLDEPADEAGDTGRGQVGEPGDGAAGDGPVVEDGAQHRSRGLRGAFLDGRRARAAHGGERSRHVGTPHGSAGGPVVRSGGRRAAEGRHVAR